MLIKRGLKHLSRVNDVLFRTLRIERDITIFPDDVFLTSTRDRAIRGPGFWWAISRIRKRRSRF